MEYFSDTYAIYKKQVIYKYHHGKVLLLFVLFVTCCICCCVSYDKKCSDVTQWKFRAEYYGCKTPYVYQCLYDKIHNTYKEFCGSEEIAREGFTYEVQLNPNQVQCKKGWFQPLKFTSVGNSMCQFIQTGCSEEGQVVHTSDSTTSDITCRCDYRKGYDFVILPKNVCYCVPSREDCTCYYKGCPEGNTVMTQDYSCVKKEHIPLPGLTRCSEIITHRNESTKKHGPLIIKNEKQLHIGRTSKTVLTVFITALSVLCVILIVRILYVFPVVVNINVDSKLGALIKNDETSVSVVEGDTITLSCCVASMCPITNIKWEKEQDGTKVPIYLEGTKFTFSGDRRQNLVITHFSSEDTGRYVCSIENCMGLTNRPFDIFLKFFVTPQLLKTKQRWVYINLLSLPCQEENVIVFAGDEITLGNTVSDQSKYTRTKWIISTHVDVNIVHSSVWKTNECCVSDAGKYTRVTVDNNQEIQINCCQIINLKVIPQRKSYEEVLEHQHSLVYVATNIIDKALTTFENQDILVITGRKGTGKHTACLQIVTSYVEKGFYPFIIDDDLHTPEHYCRYMIYLIHIKTCDEESFNKLMILITNIQETQSVNKKILITCMKCKYNYLKTKLQDKLLEFQEFDLDIPLSENEKLRILQNYSTASGNKTVLQELGSESLKTIISLEPSDGFPLTVLLFFSDKNNFRLGEYFFCRPSDCLSAEITALYHAAHIIGHQTAITKMCVLVYIIHNNQFSTSSFDCNIYRKIYYQHFGNTLEDTNEENLIKQVTTAVNSMEDKYLMKSEDVYVLISTGVLLAIAQSCHILIQDLITNGSWGNIIVPVGRHFFQTINMTTEFREECYHLLLERFKSMIRSNSNMITPIARYIHKNWIKEKHHDFKEILFKLIDSISLCENNEDLVNSVGMVLTFIKEVTNDGNNRWIYKSKVSDKMLLFSMILAAKNQYLKNNEKTFNLLLTQLKTCLQNKGSQCLSYSFDHMGNNFFHYLSMFGGDESIITMLTIHQLVMPDTNRDAVICKNTSSLTPLQIAAYLGKPTVFKTLLVNIHDQITDWEKETLQKITHLGLAQFCEENKPLRNANIFNGDNYSEIEKGLMNLIDGKVFCPGNIQKCFMYGSKTDFKDILIVLCQRKLRKEKVQQELMDRYILNLIKCK